MICCTVCYSINIVSYGIMINDVINYHVLGVQFKYLYGGLAEHFMPRVFDHRVEMLFWLSYEN